MQGATVRSPACFRAMARVARSHLATRPRSSRSSGRRCCRGATTIARDSGATPEAQASGREEGAPVTVTCRGVSFQAKRGDLLRTALLEAGVSPHNGRSKLINCRGLGTCGTCAVRIEGGAVSPRDWTTQERLRLNFPPHGPPANESLRLACQVRLVDDIVIGKMDGFWGSSGEVASSETADAFYAPFGELEYILDAKRD